MKKENATRMIQMILSEPLEQYAVLITYSESDDEIILIIFNTFTRP